jgi:8-oxo-dGTP diphosphatase
LECEELLLRGTISWPGFGKGGEDWFGFIFRIDRWSGTHFAENADGPLVWVEVQRILEFHYGREIVTFCRWCLVRASSFMV